MSIEMNNGTLRIQQIIAQSEEDKKLVAVEKDIELTCDIGNLCVSDINCQDEKNLSCLRKRNSVLITTGRDAVQTLVNNVFSMERKVVDGNPVVTLPEPLTLLPREKPIPKPKPLTKWEQYAKEKGIKKRKKENKVWDDAAQDFVPRYGKMRVELNKEKNWVMEVPRQADPYEDQFAKASAAKKDRVAKNEYQRLRNISRATKSGVPGVGVTRTDTRDVNELKKAMHFSRFATASIGKFQPMLKNEKPVKGFNKNTKQASNKPFTGSVKEEKTKAIKIMEKIRKPEVNTESNVIKEIQKNLIAQEQAEKRELAKGGRRSKYGGRTAKKSGAALAHLTGGKMGDRKAKKKYQAKMAMSATATRSGKKGKGKSAFGGRMGKKSEVRSKKKK